MKVHPYMRKNKSVSSALFDWVDKINKYVPKETKNNMSKFLDIKCPIIFEELEEGGFSVTMPYIEEVKGNGPTLEEANDDFNNKWDNYCKLQIFKFNEEHGGDERFSTMELEVETKRVIRLQPATMQRAKENPELNKYFVDFIKNK